MCPLVLAGCTLGGAEKGAVAFTGEWKGDSINRVEVKENSKTYAPGELITPTTMTFHADHTMETKLGDKRTFTWTGKWSSWGGTEKQPASIEFVIKKGALKAGADEKKLGKATVTYRFKTRWLSDTEVELTPESAWDSELGAGDESTVGMLRSSKILN